MIKQIYTTIKKILNLVVFGDTKRPPIFYGEFSSPTLPFRYKSWNEDGYKTRKVSMRLTLDTIKLELCWGGHDLEWDISIASNTHGTLYYTTTYYSAIPELKTVIDFMCDTAVTEERSRNRREKIANATQEINVYRELLPKLNAIGDTHADERRD